MADPQQGTSTNWAGVGLAGLLLVLAVVVLENQIVRALVALGALLLAVYMSQQAAQEEPEVENPLLEQLRDSRKGLDRRKYGRLRAYTDRLLEHVRTMNRLAVDARQGKMSQRHAHAELDRLAAMMRDVVDEVRKAAGVPTPVKDLAPSPKPQVVFPRKGEEGAGDAVEVEPAGEAEDEARPGGAGDEGEDDREGDEEEGPAEVQAEADDEEGEEESEEKSAEAEEDTERALARGENDADDEDEERES